MKHHFLTLTNTYDPLKGKQLKFLDLQRNIIYPKL